MGPGKGGSVLVHVGTNNVEREGTTAIVRKYSQNTKADVGSADNSVRDIISNGKEWSGVLKLPEYGN